MPPLIHVENLAKSYFIATRHSGFSGALRGLFSRESREIKALDGVSFAIEPGELVAYIGPNGAGKSTTVKILSGILVPDSGTCQVEGRIPWKDRQAHVARIGVVFGQRTQLWWDLPVQESFDLLREIYRVEPDAYQTSLDELIPMLGLKQILDIPVRQLSLGQRMRADLAASLLHRPRLLFLDEPTIGLDATSKLAVREFVGRQCREHGVTVILTTHDMDDIEALCSRVMVIGKGQLLLDGNLGDLRARFGRERRLRLDLSEEVQTLEDPDARVLSREGLRFQLAFDPEVCSTPELLARLAARYPLKDVFIEDPPIEEIVAKLYQELERRPTP
jgi:ABC-2 type transport system ATP-binding protein